MTEVSKKWQSLPAEEQSEWKSKAIEGTHWAEKPKRIVVRDLLSAIEENVRIACTYVTLLC